MDAAASADAEPEQAPRISGVRAVFRFGGLETTIEKISIPAALERFGGLGSSTVTPSTSKTWGQQQADRASGPAAFAGDGDLYAKSASASLGVPWDAREGDEPRRYVVPPPPPRVGEHPCDHSVSLSRGASFCGACGMSLFGACSFCPSPAVGRVYGPDAPRGFCWRHEQEARAAGPAWHEGVVLPAPPPAPSAALKLSADGSPTYGRLPSPDAAPAIPPCEHIGALSWGRASCGTCGASLSSGARDGEERLVDRLRAEAVAALTDGIDVDTMHWDAIPSDGPPVCRCCRNASRFRVWPDAVKRRSVAVCRECLTALCARIGVPAVGVDVPGPGRCPARSIASASDPSRTRVRCALSEHHEGEHSYAVPDRPSPAARARSIATSAPSGAEFARFVRAQTDAIVRAFGILDDRRYPEYVGEPAVAGDLRCEVRAILGDHPQRNDPRCGLRAGHAGPHGFGRLAPGQTATPSSE